MNALSSFGVLVGAAWAAGVNLYLTVAGLGLAQRAGWITLPGDTAALAHPLVIIVAIILFLIEFLADKIPIVDSFWDSVHTIIRPLAGAVLGYLALSEAAPELRYAAALLAGTIALDSHLTKATSRLAINASPEPVSNSVASVVEDVSVLTVLYLVIRHPIIAAVVVILFILFSIWFLRKMFRFVKQIFRPGKKTAESPASPPGKNRRLNVIE